MNSIPKQYKTGHTNTKRNFLLPILIPKSAKNIPISVARLCYSIKGSNPPGCHVPETSSAMLYTPFTAHGPAQATTKDCLLYKLCGVSVFLSKTKTIEGFQSRLTCIVIRNIIMT